MARFVDLLLGLRERYGMTPVIAPHDAGLAAGCDEQLRLRDGVLLAGE